MPEVCVFVDVSRDGETVFSAVVVEAGKLGVLGGRLSWVKHWRKLGRRRRRGYDPAFLRRLGRLLSSGLVVEVRLFDGLGDLAAYLLEAGYRFDVGAVYLDEYVMARLPREVLAALPARPESETTRRRSDLRKAMLLADGLAGIARERGVGRVLRELRERPQAAP